MSMSDQEWLAQLDEQSRQKQEAFLDGIAAKLGRERITVRPAHPHRGSPAFWNEFEWSLEERIARFRDNFEAAGGYVATVADWNEAAAYIGNIVDEHKAKHILRQDEPKLAEIDWQQIAPDVKLSVWNSETINTNGDSAVDTADATASTKNRHDDNQIAIAANADIGVAIADYAVAYTGSLVMMSAKERGRSVSLLPNILLALVPVDRLVTRPGEVLDPIGQLSQPGLPAGIHFISGPSRSADIENDLTIGVHGPGIVYAILIG